VLIFLAALAGVYSAQWLAGPAQRLVGRTGFQLAQLLLLLAVLRRPHLGYGRRLADVGDAARLDSAPMDLFRRHFSVHGRVVCAGLASRVGGGRHLLSPGADPRRAGLRQRAPGGRLLALRPPAGASLVSRADLLEHYVTQWMFGGVFLVLCAAATRVRVSEHLSLNVFDMGIPPAVVIAGVLYFLIGLALTSQARMAMLRAQWLLDGVEMPERLPARWRRFSLLIIAGVGLLAALLPLGSTWQLGAIVNAVAMFVVRIALLVAFLIASAFALVMSLLDEPQPMPEMPEELKSVPPLEEIAQQWQAPPWLGGALIWLVVLIALLIALRLLLGKEGLDLTRRKLLAFLAGLWMVLKSWGQSVQSLARNLQVSLPGWRGPATDERLRQPWRFIRVAGLSPRDQVRYFYLSTLRRASDQGIARQPAQTPQEFMQDLEQSWPETEVDLAALTAAFVVARYDVAEISPGEAQEVRSVWERIKRALRGKRKSEEGAVDELH
jgi:hypothetical protein